MKMTPDKPLPQSAAPEPALRRDWAALPGAVYSPSDAAAIAKQIRRAWTLLGMAALPGIVLAGVTLVLRVQWATILATVLFGGLLIFLWGMKLTPPLAYSRHLAGVREGLSRAAQGLLIRIDPETTFRDGMDFHAVWLDAGGRGDAQDERLFYWDAAKPLPDVPPGARVEIISHANTVIALQRLST